MAEHFKTLSAVFPVIFKTENNKTYVLLHRRLNTGYQDGNLDIAGSGHVDEGETAKMATARECKEELGIDVSIEDLTFIHLSHRFTDRVYYDMYFRVDKYIGTPSIMEPDKCSELGWFDIDNLPDDMIECRKIVMNEYKNGHNYTEFLQEIN